MTELPPLVNALVLHEGDTIVLSAKHDLTAEEVAYIKAAFLETAGVRAIILGPGLEVVREPDPSLHA